LIAIAGAGLAGLTAVRAFKDAVCLVFESTGRVGGLCDTDFARGFAFDRGAHISYSRDVQVTDLIREGPAH
jgi:protoporphyrinogen oxidase